jgi:hypothetical protein
LRGAFHCRRRRTTSTGQALPGLVLLTSDDTKTNRVFHDSYFMALALVRVAAAAFCDDRPSVAAAIVPHHPSVVVVAVARVTGFAFVVVATKTVVVVNVVVTNVVVVVVVVDVVVVVVGAPFGVALLVTTPRACPSQYLSFSFETFGSGPCKNAPYRRDRAS